MSQNLKVDYIGQKLRAMGIESYVLSGSIPYGAKVAPIEHYILEKPENSAKIAALGCNFKAGDRLPEDFKIESKPQISQEQIAAIKADLLAEIQSQSQP